MSTENTAYADRVREKNHSISPDTHPHLDNNSISTRVMQTTGYRPTPEALITMMVHEAKAFTQEDFAALLEGLKAIEPTPHPVN